jgi:hypothetical protein
MKQRLSDAQVRSGADGKELGEALDDAQQNGKQVVVQVSSPKDNETELLKLNLAATKTTEYTNENTSGQVRFHRDHVED